MKLLRGLKKLQELAACKKLQELAACKKFSQAHSFIQTLSLFKDVAAACFGSILDPDYQSKILKVKQSYLSLPVSVTPKVYAVFFHVPQFIDKKKTGLGLFSE